MARWSLILLICCFALASGLRAGGRGGLWGNCAQRPKRSVARSVRPNSKSSNEGPPYLEAYGYARDTENRLANQIAIGVAAFQATANEAKELLEKTSKENKELVEKTIERQNLIIFLGFALLAMLASMQPELRGFFSLFLSKIKLG
jgi:hypothetical protein